MTTHFDPENLRLVDSHAHLNMAEFDEDRPEVVQNAFQQGVQAILCPSDVTEEDRHSVALELPEAYSHVFLSAGVHPHQAHKYHSGCEELIKKLAEQGRIKAVGEIGLDFHYDFSPRSRQLEVLQKQLVLAQELDLPVIIHCRKAGIEVMKIIEKSGYDRGGVLHCFTEDIHFARKMLDKGFFISFSGIVTFPQAHELRETAREIPLDSLMVETDSPYLVPVPFRGKLKRNEPKFVKETARCLADIRMEDLRKFAERTTSNFFRCFQIEINKGR